MMKKFILLFVLGLVVSTPSVFAQKVVSMKAHKAVFHLTNNDTLVHKAMIKQINNALTAGPNTKIEVVCHNNGIEMLMTAKTKQTAAIAELKAKGVVFAACENTMRERRGQEPCGWAMGGGLKVGHGALTEPGAGMVRGASIIQAPTCAHRDHNGR